MSRINPTGRRSWKHGMSRTDTYKVWADMRSRCTLPSVKQYADYGGRGIRVCDAWLTFVGFFADMGERPDGCTLERIDNNGNYEKSNCRWATRKEQGRNRRDNHLLNYMGQTRTITEWCEHLGLIRGRVQNRLDHGWSVERALNEPVHAECRNIRR